MTLDLSRSYLSRLPQTYRYLGRYQEGEIEISTDPAVIKAVVQTRKSKTFARARPTDCLENSFDHVGIVFEDEYLLVVRDPVTFKNGKTGSYLRVFERAVLTGQAGVVILPVRNNLIYFNRIFRHATRQWEIELPRGYRDEGCSLEEAVEIELSQEVGIEMDSIRSLGEIHPNTGLLVGSVQAYFVTLAPGDASSAPEDGESISETLALSLADVHQKVIAGEIKDGFTLSALYLAQVLKLIG